jgi:DNA-binding response OmpR family regulator
MHSRSKDSSIIRVLMADPDPSLGAMYRETLLQQGFELVTAATGVACVARLRQRPPDVLVLEPQLLWGGGDGVLAIMGDVPKLAAVPVMILTSCRDPHILKGVSCFSISDYQVKPLTPNCLAERIRMLLDDQELRFTLDEEHRRLECEITRRTGGRVRDLHVDVGDGQVVVHGCTESYHVKQLVVAAVLEAIEASESQSLKVKSEIKVCGDCRSTAGAMCFKTKEEQAFLRWNGSGKAVV